MRVVIGPVRREARQARAAHLHQVPEAAIEEIRREALHAITSTVSNSTRTPSFTRRGSSERWSDEASSGTFPGQQRTAPADNLVVMEIEREVFLEVVAGHSTTNDAADEVVAQHLAAFHPARVGI